jgi:hypothetical protein
MIQVLEAHDYGDGVYWVQTLGIGEVPPSSQHVVGTTPGQAMISIHYFPLDNLQVPKM